MLRDPSALRSRRRRLVTGLVFLLSTLPSFRAAHADDDVADLETLLSENVVSGASKSAETTSDAPATTTTITAEDIRRYGIRSIDEAIDFLGMGLVTQNPLHSVEVGGRGVLLTADFGNHVLLVVDGHVMNEPWNGTAYFEQGAAVPMELVDHIELVLGPGSVLYGGSAMFGVVNVVTKRASSFKGLHIIGEASASPEQGRGGAFTSFAPGDLGGSQRLSVGGGHSAMLWGKPLDWTGQVEFYRQSGPSFAWGPQTVSNEDGSPANYGPRTPLGVWQGRNREAYGTKVPTVYTRLEWGNFAFAARAASYRRTTPYVNAFNQLAGDFDDPRSFEKDTWFSLDLQHKARLGRFSTASRLYADTYAYDQEMFVTDGSQCAVSVDGACLTRARGRSRWLGAEVQGFYDWMGDERLVSMVGLDARVRQIAGSTAAIKVASGDVAATLGDRDVTELAWAAFAQQRWTPVPRLRLNAGARFDSDPRGGNRLSPRASVAVDPWKNGVVKAIYSEAFRAPSFYEKYYESAEQRPNDAIGSEVVRSLEGTVEQRVGRHRLLMGAFRTWWSDMLLNQTVADGVLQYQNISTIDNYGYNARVDGGAGAFSYGFSVTGAHTRRATADAAEALPVAPQLFGNARVAYDLPGALPTIALATAFVGKRPADRFSDGNFSVPPYAPAQARIRLTVSDKVPWVPALSYRVSAEWVTNGPSAYVAGPTQFADPTADPRPSAELAPVNRATIFATLRYDLWP